MTQQDPNPPDLLDDDELDESERPKRWSEGVLRDTFKKAVERGIEAGIGTFTLADSAVRGVDSAVRGVVEEAKLPKELVGAVFSSIDETKNALVRGVAKEVRDFLEATDIAGEFYRALTSLSFEVKTEVRFIPNEAGGVRPQVKAKAAPKAKSTKRTRKRNPTWTEPPPPFEKQPEQPDD